MNGASNLVSILKSAGDSLRLDILAVLKEASFGVQELASIFEMSQPAMSHHLKVLLKSGLVETRREANSIFYKRSLTQRESEDFIIKKAIFESLDAFEIKAELLSKIVKIFKRYSCPFVIMHCVLDYPTKNKDGYCTYNGYCKYC